MTPDTIQKELPKLLAEFNITPEYLANELGLSFYAIRSWLNGERKPKQVVVEKVEQLFSELREKKK